MRLHIGVNGLATTLPTACGNGGGLAAQHPRGTPREPVRRDTLETGLVTRSAAARAMVRGHARMHIRATSQREARFTDVRPYVTLTKLDRVSCRQLSGLSVAKGMVNTRQ